MSDLPPPPGGPTPPPGGSTPPPPPPPGLTPSPTPPAPPSPTPPAGYTPYGAGPTPLTQLKRVKGVSVATMILTAVTGLGAVVALAVAPAASDRAADFLDGRITEDQFLDDYGPTLLAQALQGVGQIAAAILTMIWMYRVASNVRAFGRATTFAPLFAIFGWVLPPMLVVIPFLMLRELWKASDPEAPYDATGWKASADNPSIWLWFLAYGVVPTVLFVVSIDTLFGGGFSNDTEDVAEALRDFGALNVIGSLSTVVAAVLWIVVVRQITARHMRLTDER